MSSGTSIAAEADKVSASCSGAAGGRAGWACPIDCAASNESAIEPRTNWRNIDDLDQVFFRMAPRWARMRACTRFHFAVFHVTELEAKPEIDVTEGRFSGLGQVFPRQNAAVTNVELQMNTPANTRPDRIVVVDDDARIRDLLRRYLTQEGFEVLLAEDAKALNRIL